MRKKIAAAVAAIMAFAPATPARAATSVTVPGSCQLSAHWVLGMSATFKNTSGTPSQGLFHYAAIRSPGRLALGENATSAFVYTYQSGHSEFLAQIYFYFDKMDGSDYMYRADWDHKPVQFVIIRGTAPSGISCSDALSAKN